MMGYLDRPCIGLRWSLEGEKGHRLGTEMGLEMEKEESDENGCERMKRPGEQEIT
jgi:hypothetical protein